MYLKKLKINGFKSFADPTHLHFDRGVTAVVGPNGCGKSNIADAIRWVLGEQSAKALRGGTMQDVIFEGAEKRKPLQVCEVSLLFTDCEEQLGIEFNEIEITRRVSRDGQSDYFINGKACRLRDIQQVFMDTGVGRTSYSIMAQGQIDQILSSNPNERRAIFEEAAGITKYKSQRRETLSKLNAVEINLNRLTDVIDEVKRQINSLRRQASKALRYKKIRFRLQHLDLANSGRQYQILRESILAKEERVKNLSGDVRKEREALAGHEAEIDAKRAERAQANAQLQEVQQAVFDLRSTKEQAENKIHLAEARRADLEKRLEEAEEEIESIEIQLAELQEKAKGSAEIKAEQLSLVGSSDEVFQRRNEELSAIQNQLTEAEKTLDREKHNLHRYENDVARCRNQSSMIEVNLKSDQMRQESLDGEIAEVKTELEAAAVRLGSLQEDLAQINEEAAAAEASVAAAQENVSVFRSAGRDLQEQINDLEREHAQSSARLRVLRQLDEKLEGFSDGAKAFLQGKLDEELGENSRKPVAQNIRVPEKYSRAIEALLGVAMDAVAVDDPAAALSVVELLEERKLGKAWIQFPVSNGRANGTQDLPDGLQSAPALIQFEETDGEIHPVKQLLSDSYYAENAADFISFWKKNPEFTFSHVATGTGELIDGRGLIFGGFSKAKGSGILERSGEIQKLNEEVAAQQKQLKALAEEAKQRQQQLNEAEQEVEVARKVMMHAGEKRSSLQAEERSLERNRTEIQNRVQRLEKERESIDQRRGKSAEDLERIEAQVKEAQELFEGQRVKIAECETRLEELRAEREAKRESLSEIRFELAEKRQRLDALDRSLVELEQRKQELTRTLESRQVEIRVTREQIEKLGSERQAAVAEAETAAGELARMQEEVEEARTSFASLDTAITAIEKELAELRGTAEGKTGELNKIEVQLAEQRSKLGYLQEEADREYQVQLAEIDWQAMLWHADDEPEGGHPLDLEEDGEPEAKKAEQKRPITDEDRESLEKTDWDEVRREIETLRRRIQSMGPVNLVAIEEYAELKERFEFLTEQSEDLTNARDKLTAAIDEINLRSRTQFQEIFEQIRKNFKYTFETLFGGGSADLQLMEAEDVLESGVEIVAQPPGTKLKSIFLLSGGQKTMTAVALLFAIYMVKPSPFCVLDELDAPLDEANIGRFTSMLKKFTDRSQFIIITHNNRTISEASAIFGVTMEEKGVSKVVSMRFNRESQKAERTELATVETGA
ncbi:MAG TPA: chromosome segregation protein SMC [Opitutales bacterium]|nr:chromosome segregation protein SMC [Opitutales bacterium]